MLPSPFISKVFCATNHFYCRSKPIFKCSLLKIISLAESFLFEALSEPMIYFSEILFPVPFQYFSSKYFLTRILFSLKWWHLILTFWLHWCFDVTSNFLLRHVSHETICFFRFCFYHVFLLFIVLPLALFFTSELSLPRFLPNIFIESLFFLISIFSISIQRFPARNIFPFRFFFPSEYYSK